MTDKRSNRFFMNTLDGVEIERSAVRGPNIFDASPKRAASAVFGGLVVPSADLEAVIGKGQITRGEMVSKVWDYIKKNNLQNPANKREILADGALRKVFGKPRVTMFEMNKLLAKNVQAGPAIGRKVA